MKMYGDDKYKFALETTKAVPKRSTLKLLQSERALGHLLNIRVPSKPYDSKGDFKGHDVVEEEFDLARDTFYALYKFDPQILENYLPDPETGKPDPRVPPSLQIRASILDWLMGNEAYQNAHMACVASIIGSSSATTMLYNVLLENQQMQEMMEQMGQALQLEKQGDGDEEGPGQGRAKAQQIADDVRQKIEKMKGNALADAMLSDALEQAEEAGQDARHAFKAWGWGSESGYDNVDIDSINKIMDLNPEILEQLGALLGRMEGLASNTIEQVKDSPVGAVAEVDVTRDLIKLFPLERAYLSDKAPQLLRTNKVLNWVTHGLIGWKHKGEGRKSGSFVAMIDGSGSMFGGQPPDIVYAISIGLGVARALRANMGDKVYSLGIFGDHYDSISWVRHDNSVGDHMTWASTAPAGGTDFNKAIRKSIDEIRRQKKAGQEGVDLLFITDGYARMNDKTIKKWVKAQEETNTRMFYVNIGGNEINEQVKKLSDATYNIGRMSEQAEALTIDVVKEIMDRRAM
jgi:uncharacterized protein with von Willebrand factor type A (vWA) domain